MIVDSILLTLYNSLEELISVLKDYSVLFVHVTCSIEDLRKREIERGDREQGQAESQLQYLVPKDIYDLTVDTSLFDVDNCAEKILEIVKHPNQWKAFKMLCEQPFIDE